MRNSPTALRVLKAALNAAEDGQAGIQVSGPLLFNGFFCIFFCTPSPSLPQVWM